MIKTYFRSAIFGAVFLLAVLLGLGCSSKGEQGGETPEIGEATGLPPLKGATVPEVPFKDITDKAGIRFRHTNGAFGKKLLPETMGSGVAFLDYDNDGKQDLLFINSCYWPGYEHDRLNPTLALYHNEGHDTFKDVTSGSGLDVAIYGMG